MELALTDWLKPEQSRELLGYWRHETEVTVEQIMLAGLRHKLPFKTNAMLIGLELPEVPLGLFANVFTKCWCCGKQHGVHVHHIERRPHCFKPYRDRVENLFRVCFREHERLHGESSASQIARRWQFCHAGWLTLDEYLVRFLEIADPERRAPNRITRDEVTAEIKKLELAVN